MSGRADDLDVSDGYRRGPWTVQVLGAAAPDRAETLRRAGQRLGSAVLDDLDADYADLLARRP